MVFKKIFLVCYYFKINLGENMNKMIIASLVLFGLADNTAAAGCRQIILRNNRVVNNCAVKTVVTPSHHVFEVAAFPVFVPLFQYQYNPPCCTVQTAATAHSQYNNTGNQTSNPQNYQNNNNQGEDKDDGPPVAVFQNEPAPVNFLSPTEILKRNCFSCHNSLHNKGGVVLFLGNNLNQRINKNRVWAEIESDAMPPDPHTKLTPQEKTIIKAWKSALQ